MISSKFNKQPPSRQSSCVQLSAEDIADLISEYREWRRIKTAIRRKTAELAELHAEEAAFRNFALCDLSGDVAIDFTRVRSERELRANPCAVVVGGRQ